MKKTIIIKGTTTTSSGLFPWGGKALGTMKTKKLKKGTIIFNYNFNLTSRNQHSNHLITISSKSTDIV